jgi:hypothetical protein
MRVIQRLRAAIQKTLEQPWSRPAVETPIERIFHKTVERQMTKEERLWIQLKPNPTLRQRRVADEQI